MIGQILDHYRIVERIGEGGMGVVYRAWDNQLNRDVALKVLPQGTEADAPARAQLLSEARLASALNHPSICTVYQVGESAGQAFIAMEYLEGQALSALIPGEGLPAETVIRYGAQIADALDHAHSRGVIHRDLKSANVRITPQGRCKVLDFGLATRLPQEIFSADTQSLASPGSDGGIAGTLHYMSPEALRGGPSDARSDIWSLGIILHEMASGELPFRGHSGFALPSAILRDPPSPLPARVPASLRAVVRRCLTKEPAGRYQHANEIRAALEAIHSDQTAAPAGLLQGRRWRGAGARALFLLLLLLAGAAVPSVSRRIKQWLGSASIPQPRQLAVLPFHAVDSDPQTTAFGNGLTETLNARLTQLSQKHALQVIPASEVRSRGISTLQQARQEFGVNLGLEISLHRAGEMIRVTYSLVDAGTSRQIGAGTVTARAADPFAVEDQVTDSVLNTLAIELEPQERVALAAHGTTEPAAFDYYLQGRGYLQEYQRPENVDNAIAVFQHALERDPNYALAFAGLGEAYWRRYERTKDAQWVNQARSACERAVALQSEQSQSHACLGMVDTGTGKYEQAVAEYQRAVQLEPTSDAAHAGLAAAYERLGKPEEAERSYRQAIAQRPNYASGYNWLGAFFLRHGRYPEAARMFTQMVSLAPDSFVGHSNLGSTYVLQGKYAEAIPLLERSIAIRPTAEASSNLGTAYFQMKRYAEAASINEQAVKLDERNYEVWGNLGDSYYWAPGRRGEASGAYQKAIALANQKLQVNPRDSSLLGYVSTYYAMLGDRAKAIDFLGRALALSPKDPDLLFSAAVVHNQFNEANDALGWLDKALAAGFSPATLRDSPNFDNLRGNPRFQQLLAKKSRE